ncbi:MAG: hypothetical protein P1P65_04645 [Treponema sp.]
MKAERIKQLFTLHDTGAFAGLFADVFSKIAIIITVLTAGGTMPASLVLGKILPGLAAGSIVGSLLYVREAYRLGIKENRTDVTALPFGIGSTQVFGWLFIIILPVYRQTGDAVLAWSVGIAACFIGGLVEIAGAITADTVKKYIPQSALIANMAAAAFIWLSFNGIVTVFNQPALALPAFFIALISIFRRKNIVPRIPNTLLILGIGSISAWLTHTAGTQQLQTALNGAGWYPPHLCLSALIRGLRSCTPYLSVIIPLQIANVITTIQAAESAALSGDRYPLRRTLMIDGLTTIISALFGSPFPTTVYFGHSGWKRIGARSGYLALMPAAYILLFFGIPLIMTALIPFEVIIIFVITAGITVVIDVHNTLPEDHGITVYLSFIPLLAQYIISIFETVLPVLGTSLQALQTTEEIAGTAVTGLLHLSQGAFASSLLYSIWIAYILEKNYRAAGITAAVLAVLAAIGFIHQPEISFLPAGSIPFAAIYGCLSVVCMMMKKEN